MKVILFSPEEHLLLEEMLEAVIEREHLLGFIQPSEVTHLPSLADKLSYVLGIDVTVEEVIE